jgi:hypothetical protein
LGQGGSISVLLEAFNIREQALGLVDVGAADHPLNAPAARLQRVNSVTIHTREFGPAVLCRPRQDSVVNLFHPTDEIFEAVSEIFVLEWCL